MSEKIVQRNEEVIKRKLFGAARSLHPPPGNETRRYMSTLRIGEIVLWKVGVIRMSMWMGSICAATVAESFRM